MSGSQKLVHPLSHCPQGSCCTRRTALAGLAAALAGGACPFLFASPIAHGQNTTRKGQRRLNLSTPDREAVDRSVEKGLRYLAKRQTRLGMWQHETYPTAITALAGLAMICSGNTTVQGPYADNVGGAVNFLLTKCRKNGLIGDPRRDHRYTYGHGFAMLFLSQVLGEEEDIERRDELIAVLERAVQFSISAQTGEGGWGYVSSKDSDFDEGSTTITQVQALRGCRNGGIVVPAQPLEAAKNYIYKCKNSDGGISYSTSSRGVSRPAITAAALAALYNAGDYESEHIPDMWAYCKKHLHDMKDDQYGHWHYTYLYYTQVVYSQGAEIWEPWRDKLCAKIIGEQAADGSWSGTVSPEYTTSCNLIMLQMDNGFLPIFQR